MAQRKGTADHYNRRAHHEGFAARSVYKLDEMDRRFHLLRAAERVLDLGCSPGSWSQYVAKVRGPRVRLVGVDLEPLDAYVGTYVQGSILELDRPTLLGLLQGPADLVLSDMAPRTTGQRFADHCAQIELARAALEVATAALRPGGAFVVKVFDGEDGPAYVQEVRARFERTERVRPDATRSTSREFFLVGLGHRPTTAPAV